MDTNTQREREREGEREEQRGEQNNSERKKIVKTEGENLTQVIFKSQSQKKRKKIERKESDRERERERMLQRIYIDNSSINATKVRDKQ